MHPSKFLERNALENAQDRHEALNAGIVRCDPLSESLAASAHPLAAGDYFALFLDGTARPGEVLTQYLSGPRGATLSFSVERIPNSGGHHHGTGMAGTLEPTSIVLPSGYPQNVPQRFTAPEAGGVIRYVIRGSNGQTITHHVTVAIPGLMQFTGGTGIVLTGSTATHPNGHWGTPQLIDALIMLGQHYFDKYSRPIFVNDMSLQGGGLFDHQATWRPPHHTHRDGRRVDINSTSMSDEQQAFFRLAAAEAGFAKITLEDSPPHWHLEI